MVLRRVVVVLMFVLLKPVIIVCFWKRIGFVDDMIIRFTRVEALWRLLWLYNFLLVRNVDIRLVFRCHSWLDCWFSSWLDTWLMLWCFWCRRSLIDAMIRI